MRKLLSILILISIIIATMGTGCKAAKNITILYSNDLNGEVGPCG